jgi:2-dehydropantoate 2-reductase
MRIAIVGTGGVGGYFGAHLAKAGHAVTFLARGGHLEAMRAKGLTVTGPNGDIILNPVDAQLSLPPDRNIDVALFCVKLYDTEAAAEPLAKAMGGKGIVIPLQNGVESRERLMKFFADEQVVPGLAGISATISEPGVIRYVARRAQITFGATKRPPSAIAVEFAKACNAAGFPAMLVDNVEVKLWEKFVLLATNSAMASLARKPAGVLYQDEDTCAVARRGLSEAAAVGRAEGVALDETIVERSLADLKTFPIDMYPSMYHDLNRGRRMELNSLSGAVVRMAKKHGIDVPVHQVAYGLLKHYVNGSNT